MASDDPSRDEAVAVVGRGEVGLPTKPEGGQPLVNPTQHPRFVGLPTEEDRACGADAMPDASLLRQLWRALADEGEVREVRIPKARRGPARLYGTVSGYFDDERRFVEAVGRLRGQDAEGVYITLNPVNPDLLARAANRLENMAKAMTSDADIVRRRNLLIDIDPRRPAGISATESERMAAVETRERIESFLRDLWGTDPLYVAMSGNGGGLVYRIDLPNDPDSLALVASVLKALAAQFDDDAVSIDQTVANAARITKVIGTVAAKGDDTPSLDRRWRRATATFPADPHVVTREQLQMVAAVAEPKVEEAAPKVGEAATAPDLGGDGFTFGRVCNGGARSWTVPELLAEHDIVARKVAKPYGTVYELDRCLTSADHDGGAAVVELTSGALAYRCHHNSCSGRTWADARAALGLSAREAGAPSAARGEKGGGKPPSNGDEERADDEQAKATAAALRLLRETAATAASLADFAPAVQHLLNLRQGRRHKEVLADTLAAWAIRHGRLLVADDGDGLTRSVFLVDDDDAVVPLEDRSRRVEDALARVGINGSEATFAWTVKRLRTAAANDGARRVRLEQYVARRDGRLYVSCGPTRVVVAEAGRPLRTVRNGTDGVLFQGDAVLARWDPEAAPVDPLTLAVLQPNLEAPPEVPEYGPDAQRLLLRGMLVAMMAGLRPLAAMLALGSSDGGKTSLARGVVRLFLGGDADVCDAQGDARDFTALISALPLVAIDNVDGDPPAWMHDALATAVTGARVGRRVLYTDGDVAAKKITATLLITSRTAAFARRNDIMERLLPLFVISPERRLADSELYGELARARDGALAWLAATAAEALARAAEAPERLPSRFVDWARVVWALDPEHGPSALEAMARAQQLAIVEPDELGLAIVTYVREHGAVEGTPSEIVGLVDQYRDLSFFGGGKAIGRRLRELAKGYLPRAGVRCDERTSGNARKWSFRLAAPAGAVPDGETEKTENISNVEGKLKAAATDQRQDGRENWGWETKKCSVFSVSPSPRASQPADEETIAPTVPPTIHPSCPMQRAA